ncbi:sulfatase-like hydrolase/transferase [Vibrio celticus]|uniref:sulfatase-like hydrolase/transferase n=1 Tax=Vibrio celticus TaxID=446372 RepID=UPI0011127C58|nr:sulfatase-like hydrolase/transferase [Vibrio celticus]
MLAALSGSATAIETSDTKVQPNVLLIYFDDIGYADMGFQNISQDVFTPNMDKIAADGAIFSANYVTDNNWRGINHNK